MGIVSLLIGIIGIAVGAFITWRVADRYYKKASDDLIKETADLRKLNILILRAMENAKLAEFNRDENGNIMGIVLKFATNIKVESKTSTPDIKLE